MVSSTTESSGNPTFRLEFDLSIFFVPPMDDHGPGIRLTRSFELPFPPTEGLCLNGAAFNPHSPSSEDFPVKGVTWDMDRRIFLAGIVLVCQDHPIESIPDELRAWIERGWRLGDRRGREKDCKGSLTQVVSTAEAATETP